MSQRLHKKKELTVAIETYLSENQFSIVDENQNLCIVTTAQN